MSMQATVLVWLLPLHGPHAPGCHRWAGQADRLHGCAAGGMSLARQACAHGAELAGTGSPWLKHCTVRVICALLHVPLQELQSPADQ